MTPTTITIAATAAQTPIIIFVVVDMDFVAVAAAVVGVADVGGIVFNTVGIVVMGAAVHVGEIVLGNNVG